MEKEQDQDKPQVQAELPTSPWTVLYLLIKDSDAYSFVQLVLFVAVGVLGIPAVMALFSFVVYSAIDAREIVGSYSRCIEIQKIDDEIYKINQCDNTVERLEKE